MQKGAEFNHFALNDALTSADSGACYLTCERTQIKRDGSSFVVAIVVAADIEIYSRRERVVLEDCQGAETNKQKVTFYSATTFSGDSEVEDDFEAESVADVLIPAAQVLVQSCSCSAGEISAEGEIYLSLLCMRGDKPVCLERVVPFKNSIACDCSYTSNALVRAEISDLNVTATVNEEKGKCQINFVCNLRLCGSFYEGAERQVVVDAFACDSNLDVNFAKETCSPFGEVKMFTERVGGIAATKEKLDYSARLLAAALPAAEYTYSVDSGMLEGGIVATLIYEQNDEIKSTPVNLPFALPLNGTDDAHISVAVCGVSVKQPSEGEIDVEAVIKISATGYKQQECSYVTGIEEGERLAGETSAVSVLMPNVGDQLWDIAKRLKMPPDVVAACNGNISYPLSGKERIIIYRQKQS
jgi:hypothetical protein